MAGTQIKQELQEMVHKRILQDWEEEFVEETTEMHSNTNPKEIVTINGEKFEIMEIPDENKSHPKSTAPIKLEKPAPLPSPVILNNLIKRKSSMSSIFTIDRGTMVPKMTQIKQIRSIPKYPSRCESTGCEDCKTRVFRKQWIQHHMHKLMRCWPCKLVLGSMCKYRQHLLFHKQKANTAQQDFLRSVTAWQNQKRETVTCTNCSVTFYKELLELHKDNCIYEKQLIKQRNIDKERVINAGLVKKTYSRKTSS